ncbi:MAG TPA: hypothetical protein VGH49_17635 [Xanthobacteraceae bacterium]|jgi:hypothetical protein
MGSGVRVLAGGLVAAVCLGSGAARAVDEIQVYNAEIADPGQWTLQQHFNYAINGRKEPDFPNGLVPNHALNGTPELAYGITDWWEMGWYAPFAFDQNGRFYSDGFKIRELFVSPNAAKREFFYGVNFEASYATQVFSQTKYNLEIRPIIGLRKGDYEFIVNPIVDIGFGHDGDAEFDPAVRIARKLKQDLSIGLEYYTALGPIGNFLPFGEQQHNIYGVVDFKVGQFDVDFGIGYGFTGGSDRLIAKLIVGTNLNDPNVRPTSKK